MAKPADARRVQVHPPLFELTGGRLCLDFTNTVDNRPSPRRRDLLRNYSDLISWSCQTGIVSGGQAKQLGRKASAHPQKAETVLRRGKELREAIYGVFSAIAHGRRPSASELDVLNKNLGQALSRSQVVRKNGGFSWELRASPGELGQVLWPVARSALNLLVSTELNTIRECAADDCAWLFLDGSRNRSRRWCDMKVCGNRSKIRRFRKRAPAARDHPDALSHSQPVGPTQKSGPD